MTLFNNIYQNRRVFITGHTGFKGSWLAFWLRQLGAHVFGYSLDYPTQPNHFQILNLDMEHMIADIRDDDVLYGAVKDFRPEAVFHLAAQPLVRLSYDDPVTTFDTNVMGTLKVFEACRRVGCVKAILNITSDKCYENHERLDGYREDEPMGGHDPYSCSNGCAELVTSSYRRSFFPLETYGKAHTTLLASCRAGNVIGGGDWACDRLIPDVMRAVEQGKKIYLRYPDAVRPWQHVLEPLSGYLLLGQRLLDGETDLAGGWNFGPRQDEVSTVRDVVKKMSVMWDRISFGVDHRRHLHEAGLLQLDCRKADAQLQWHEVWGIDRALERTVQWYKNYYEEGKSLTADDLDSYVDDASQKGLVWAQ